MNKEKKETPSKEISIPTIAETPKEVKIFDPERDLDNAKKASKALMSVLEAKEKKVVLNGKQYLEFGDWQTLAKFFNITTGTDWTKPIKEGEKIIGYEAKAIAYQNGVIIGGAEAACMRDENNWRSKPEFQLRSMAQTRAHAKALRSLLGYIAVLAGMADTPAEEMDGVLNPTPITLPTKIYAKPTKTYAKSIDYPVIIRNSKTKKELEKIGEELKIANIEPEMIEDLRKLYRDRMEMLNFDEAK